MSNAALYVQLVAYLAALAAASALCALGKLDSHVIAAILGAAIPGPASMLWGRSQFRSQYPPPMDRSH